MQKVSPKWARGGLVLVCERCFKERIPEEDPGVAESIGDADGAQAIERERLIRGYEAGHRTMRPRAKFSAFGENHIGRRDKPGLFIRRAHLNEAVYRDDENMHGNRPTGLR